MIEFFASIVVSIWNIVFVKEPVLTVLFTIIFGAIGYLMFTHSKYHFYRAVSIDYYQIKEQMKISEQKADAGEDSMLALFLVIRKEAKESKQGLMDDEEVKRFQLLLKYLKKKALKKMRHFYRENHLADKSPSEYEIHIEQRSEDILRELREYYNSWFMREGNPSVEMFYDRYVAERRTEIKEMIKQCFRDARNISLNFRDKKYVRDYIKITEAKV